MATDPISATGTEPDQTVRLTFDGMPVSAESGSSVAAALTAWGCHGFSRDVKGNGRGLFCGMGTCHDCLVTIDGRVSQRACMRRAEEGMAITLQEPRPRIESPAIADLAPLPEAIPSVETDLMIVGAGPGGLAAAEIAAKSGLSVTIVDERHAAGGQFFKQPANAGARKALAGDRQAADGAELIARVAEAGVNIHHETLVWGGFHEEDRRTVLSCLGPDGAFYCKARAIIIATGAHERPPAVSGWTLPGAMTVGAAQTLLRSYGTLSGRSIVIAGNGPLNFQVALEIIRAGGKVAAIIEEAASPFTQPMAGLDLVRSDRALAIAGTAQLARLQAAGVKIHWKSRIARIEGSGGVETVTLEGPRGRKTIPADTVLIGGSFTSSNELPRLLGCAHSTRNGALETVTDDTGKTSLPHIHVIGEAARFGGAFVAMSEGRIAAASLIRQLGGDTTADTATETRKLARHRRFQKALWLLFAPVCHADTAPEYDTIICRCEGVSFKRLHDLVERGVSDIASLKRLTRAGMGRCQSRYCGRALAEIANGAKPASSETSSFLAPQMPLRPVPLSALAVEKAEWGGHKHAMLPLQPPFETQEPLPFTRASTVVIGGGIAGISTALFLARAGEDVVVLEHAFPNAVASGGNAGSLHAQLLSFDHGARAEAGGGPAARTLPLQRDSIGLWQELQKETGCDFELKITGGLMVAETEAHLRFLEEKTEVERRAGISCHVIGKQQLRKLEPALSEQFIGAAYCPQEGKINPLVATDGVLREAKRNGAQLFDRCTVKTIERDHDGFTLTTSRGTIKAKRVVNAAGAFASRIGAMLGLDVPVFGAPLQMVVTEAAAPTITALVAHADRHLTLKQASNGNFIIGGGWTAGLDPVHQHPRPLPASLEGNLWVAQHVVPGLRKLHVIRSWAAMNINIDGAPILGEHPACPGFFNAVTSNGYTLGPLVGRTTAQAILGEDAGFDTAPFSIERFSGTTR
ncbi:FAD-dependent oxidoreductase [Martelella radicis]|uniref:Glycine/D-amino acid oxidase-like deaminating enzyme/bacterioferritin-associated ferredoxin n=1 Tax=Martelella radicis TaxID=1397476 RepID=A0A7W6KL55_9HYPH|nr:FAD-dependent oxidoreductase [Martelella radicis]MBB4123344.1 glycine/D-amino acid oxidase-like deaminating enzyme/bacterioferritin-associated ferredoxin [Martelella radicis]